MLYVAVSYVLFFFLGGCSLRLGFVCSLLAQRVQPDHRLRRLGQNREGVELGQLQAQGQPLRPQRLLEHGDRLTRRFAVRFRRQRRPSHAVGLERQQTFVHIGQWRQHQRALLLAKPLLAVRCHRQLHQDLGKLLPLLPSNTLCVIDLIDSFFLSFFRLDRTWSTRSLSTSSRLRSLSQRSALFHNASRSPGQPMVKHFTRVTQIMSFVSGKSR